MGKPSHPTQPHPVNTRLLYNIMTSKTSITHVPSIYRAYKVKAIILVCNLLFSVFFFIFKHNIVIIIVVE